MSFDWSFGGVVVIGLTALAAIFLLSRLIRSIPAKFWRASASVVLVALAVLVLGNVQSAYEDLERRGVHQYCNSWQQPALGNCLSFLWHNQPRLGPQYSPGA